MRESLRTPYPHRALKQEKKDIRLAITPLLQAEEDARFVEEVRNLAPRAGPLQLFFARNTSGRLTRTIPSAP